MHCPDDIAANCLYVNDISSLPTQTLTGKQSESDNPITTEDVESILRETSSQWPTGSITDSPNLWTKKSVVLHLILH